MARGRLGGELAHPIDFGSSGDDKGGEMRFGIFGKWGCRTLEIRFGIFEDSEAVGIWGLRVQLQLQLQYINEDG